MVAYLLTNTAAAMRLRQLRTTQRISFFVPPEVDQSIRDFCRPAANKKLNSSHVVSWLLEQTCRSIEDLWGLYVAQGIDFCRRTDAEWRHGPSLSEATHRMQLLDVLRQPERQTLEQLYGGAGAPAAPGGGGRTSASAPRLQAFVDRLTARHGGTRAALQIGAFEEVEQQREVQNQVEQVRQVQKPTRYAALTFPGLHPAVAQFACTGILSRGGDGDGYGFEHAFTYLSGTGVGRQFGVRKTGSRMFVSAQFGRTIDCRRDRNAADNFLVSFLPSYTPCPIPSPPSCLE